MEAGVAEVWEWGGQFDGWRGVYAGRRRRRVHGTWFGEEGERKREGKGEREGREGADSDDEATDDDRSEWYVVSSLYIYISSIIVPCLSSFLSLDPRSILIHTRLTDLISNDMSPIQETDSVADSNLGVTRSRTLPSRSTKANSSAIDEKENSTMDTMNTQPMMATRTQGSKEKLKGSVREKGVLRKQRRASTPSGRSAMVA